MQVCQRACILTAECYTWRRINPLVVADELDRHTMVAVNKSRKEGIVYRGGADNSSRPSTSRGSQGGAGNWQAKAETKRWYSS